MKRASVLLNVQDAWRENIRGEGVTAAVLDTGIALHPDLKNRIIGFKDYVNGRTSCYDDYGHGTHVSGILGGNGSIVPDYCGIAPSCRLISVKVLDRNGNGKREIVTSGIRWVIKNRERYGIRIVNISVGTMREGDIKDDVLIEAVEEAWDRGLTVIVAAGNLGPGPSTITAPGNSRKVITVGSSDKGGPLYSGRGPTSCCVCKPDIVAPGSGIVSCNYAFKRQGNYYCTKSGTSMATPMVSGAAALLLSREPWLSNVEIKMRLRETAVDLGLDHNRQGWGRLDICRFLRLKKKTM